MARYDCFTFFNELDVLEVRLHELYDHVDVFVLVEAPWTFQGHAKRLMFDENRQRFKRFLPKIRHIVMDERPDTTDPWQREYQQRNAIRRGLLDAKPDDLVLVSDVDEIPRSAAIDAAARQGGFCFLRQELYYYYFDWVAHPWLKAYCAPFSQVGLMEDLSVPRVLEDRFLAVAGLGADHIIENAGWHFSWMGGVARMMDKLGAFAHTEPGVQRWKNPADLQAALDAKVFFVGDVKLTRVGLGGLPGLVRRRAGDYHRRGLLEGRPSVWDSLSGRKQFFFAKKNQKTFTG